jgi:5-methylcytosine-specific restriction protein A
MPTAAPRWCLRCRAPHPSGSECPAGKAERKAEIDQRRPSAARRGYHSKWRGYRMAYLKQHPHCRCGARATVVDHIVPVALGGSFWDEANHQPLCARCHARKTMAELNERRVPRRG